jgi:probable rRNA maturation factor
LNTLNKIHLINKTDKDFESTGLERLASCTAELLDAEPRELGLAIVDDTEIQQLNAGYRGKDSITDVLSFSMDAPHLPFLGDIVIDIYQADRQKGSRTLAEELEQLFLHGLLHLYGFDHIAANDKIEMETLEQKIMKYYKEN